MVHAVAPHYGQTADDDDRSHDYDYHNHRHLLRPKHPAASASSVRVLRQAGTYQNGRRGHPDED
jgi:hypothetical protein